MLEDSPSEVHKKSRLDKMNRRTFATTLVASGFSFGTAVGLTADDVEAAKRDEVPIVIGYSNEENSTGRGRAKVHKENLPARWYDRLSRARVEYKRFLNGKRIAGYNARDEAVKGVWVSSGSIDGQRPYLEVEVTDVELVPLGYNESNGVPVRISPVDQIDSDDEGEERNEETEEGELSLLSHTRDRRAGEKVGRDGSYGTLGAPVRDSYGADWHFLTCEHLAGGLSVGDTVYTSGSSTSEIGEVVDADCSDDFAVIEPTGNYEPSRKIRLEGDMEIGGSFSKDGLARLEEEEEEVTKSGQKTDVTSGEIENHDGTYWVNKFSCPRRTNQLRWGDEDDFSSGDSGSPVYAESPGLYDSYWVAASGHAVRPDHTFGGDFVHGTAAWVLQEHHDWQFY